MYAFAQAPQPDPSSFNYLQTQQLGGAPLGNELTKESAILNSLIRAETENTKASQERDAALKAYRQMQHAYHQLLDATKDSSKQLAEIRTKSEETGRQHEAMMKTMGDQAFTEALAYLKKLLEGVSLTSSPQTTNPFRP